MKRKIAIEPALSDVKAYLSGQGYDVVSMKPHDNLKAYDAVIVTGLNTNLSGIDDTDTKAVVINADGLTPPQVAQRLDQI